MSVGLPGGDNFEPMQVDPEENDNDEGAGMGPDVRLAHQLDPMGQVIGGGIGVNGGPILGVANGVPGIMRGGGLAGVSGAGALPHGDLHGEDVRVFYNIENPSIDLETYVLGKFHQLRVLDIHIQSINITLLNDYIFLIC